MFRFAAIALALLVPATSFAQTTTKVCPPHTVVPGGFRSGFGFGGFNRFGFNPFFHQSVIAQPIIVSQPPVVAFGGAGFGYVGAGYGFGAGCCGAAQQVISPPIVAATPQCGAEFGYGAVSPCATAGFGYGAGFSAAVPTCASTGFGYGSGFGFGATPVLGGGCNPAFVGGFNSLGFNNGFGFNRGFGFRRGLLGLGGVPLVGGILDAVLGGGLGNNLLAGRRFAGIRRR